MTAPTPASLSSPIPSALARAISHAHDTADTAASIDLAIMWATVSQAQEAHRLRRETRNLADQVRRLTRALTEEADA